MDHFTTSPLNFGEHNVSSNTQHGFSVQGGHQYYTPAVTFQPNNRGLTTTAIAPSPMPRILEHDVMEIQDNVKHTPVPPTEQSHRKRKGKAPTLRAKDWEPYKARIIELHVTQNVPLKEVKEQIFQEYGFTAEERQYRTRLSQWKVDKNVKPDEMKAIVRKRQRRKLTETEKAQLNFTVRGNAVDYQKVERWMKRNNVAESMLYSPSVAASTPSAVDYRTISDRTSPASIHAHPIYSPFQSPRYTASMIQSPQLFSPALSISSIIKPKASTFTGQSPALSHRSLPPFLSGLFSPEYDGLGRLNSVEHPKQLRYRQREEEQLRKELAEAELQFGHGPHPTICRILGDLVVLLEDQGRFKSAEEVARRLVLDCRTIGGEHDLGTLQALRCLGRILYRQGSHSDAERLQRRTLESLRSNFGHEHVVTVASMGELGRTYLTQNLNTKAADIFTQVVASMERIYGPEHHDTLIAKADLAHTNYQQGRSVEAHTLQMHITESATRILGPDHITTLTFTVALVWTSLGLGQLKEAQELGLRVLKTCTRILGLEHPDTLWGMHILARVWKAQGNKADAIDLMRECVRIQHRTLGPKHPESIHSLKRLSEWERSEGSDVNADALVPGATHSMAPSHSRSSEDPMELDSWMNQGVRPEDNVTFQGNFMQM